MKTHFAPDERAGTDELASDIKRISRHPVIDGLMNFASGLFAVLNEHRQVLALNESFLKMLGVEDVNEVIGLRPGETIGCVHAHELPGGCGTSEFCSTCGAAIAMVTSLMKNRPVEQKCAITVKKDNKNLDIYLKVRACPVSLGERQIILIFLQDISKEQQWSNLEQVFFHDINNLVFSVLGRAELLLSENGMDDNQLARQIYQLTTRLSNEISIQRQLFKSGLGVYQPNYSRFSVERVFQELQNQFTNHALATDKILRFPDILPDLLLKTDFHLLIRILENMIFNALEASRKNDEVRLSLEVDLDEITFFVWNREPISETISRRIFQRNFSTRPGLGRGLGTYAMKLFGEEILGGRVSFNSTPDEGTKFWLSLGI